MLYSAPLPDNSVLGPSIRDVERTNPLLLGLIQPSFGVLRDHPQEARLYLRWKCHHV